MKQNVKPCLFIVFTISLNLYVSAYSQSLECALLAICYCYQLAAIFILLFFFAFGFVLLLLLLMCVIVQLFTP